MEIVIDIDDEVYKRFMDDYVGCPDIIYAVRKGIPLPKGHGRLIDADALYDNTKLCHTEEDGTACVEWREINDAPTIIEGSDTE